MALECIQRDANGDLIRLPCSAPDDIPRLYIARDRQRDHLYFRSDIPVSIRQQLLSLRPAQLWEDTDHVKAILDAAATGTGAIWRGKSYIAVRVPAIAGVAAVAYIAAGDHCRLIIDGETVAQCLSIRTNQAAAEAYVETHPDFRRRGFAKRVTAAWIQRVMASGRIPYYSHHIDNIASQHLAQALGLTQYIDDIGYE